MGIESTWKAKYPIFEAIVAGLGVKLPQKIGHLESQAIEDTT